MQAKLTTISRTRETYDDPSVYCLIAERSGAILKVYRQRAAAEHYAGLMRQETGHHYSVRVSTLDSARVVEIDQRGEVIEL